MPVLGKPLLVEQLVHVGLSCVDCAPYWCFYLAELVLMFLHLFNLNLLNVLTDLFGKKVAKLIAYLMTIVEISSQLVGVITFTNKDVFVTPFSDLNRQSKYLFPFS